MCNPGADSSFEIGWVIVIKSLQMWYERHFRRLFENSKCTPRWIGGGTRSMLAHLVRYYLNCSALCSESSAAAKDAA